MNTMLATPLELLLTDHKNGNDHKLGFVSVDLCRFIDSHKKYMEDNRFPWIKHNSSCHVFRIRNSAEADLDYPLQILATKNRWVLPIAEMVLRPQRSSLPMPKLQSLDKQMQGKEGASENSDDQPGNSIEFLTRLFNNVPSLYMSRQDKIELAKLIKAQVEVYHKLPDLKPKNLTKEEGEQKIANLNGEQRACYESIISEIDKDQKDIKIFLIEGAAGCGKTAVVEAINVHLHFNYKVSDNIKYITQTNVLCHSMEARCPFKEGAVFMTLYQFFKALDLSYRHTIDFMSFCDAVSGDTFQQTCREDFLRGLNNVLPLGKKFVIIFDEIFMWNSGRISFIIFLIRQYKIRHPNVDFYVILIGDEKQLQPYQVPKELKIRVSMFATKQYEYEENFTSVERLMRNDCISAWQRYVLTKQHRIVDSDYCDFVDFIRSADTAKVTDEDVMFEISRRYPEKLTDLIIVDYPWERIDKLLAGLNPQKDFEKIVRAFGNEIDSVLDTTVFCYTNKHAHYYNLALAYSVERGLPENKRKDTIHWSVFFTSSYNLPNIEQNVSLKHLNISNHLFNVLPLIRYYPYKVLECRCNTVPRLSIVVLLDWVVGKGCLHNVIVYSPMKKTIFSIMPCTFRMNMFAGELLYGLPLQLAFSSTFASSQGLTLSNKIAISCVNITKSELYVCLTRIRQHRDLVAIL